MEISSCRYLQPERKDCDERRSAICSGLRQSTTDSGRQEFQPAHRDHSALPLARLPFEILEHLTFLFRRGDVLTLSRMAATNSVISSLCSPLLYRVYACRQCSTPIAHPQDMIFRRWPNLFEDGPVLGFPLAIGGKSNTSTLASEGISQKPSFYDDSLALRLTDLVHQIRGNSTTSANHLPLQLQHLYCKSCDLYLGNHISSPSADMATEKGEGFAFICARYTQMLDSEGPCKDASTVIRCSGARRLCGTSSCGQPLCERNSVLSTRHSWSPPGGRTEDAWFVNGFFSGSVDVGPARIAQLTQGTMEVADVSCSACRGVVGWKFVKDLDKNGRNRNQVGRCGLCTSSIGGLEPDFESTSDVSDAYHYSGADSEIEDSFAVTPSLFGSDFDD